MHKGPLFDMQITDYELQNVKTQMELIDGIKKVSKEFIILGHYPKANP